MLRSIGSLVATALLLGGCTIETIKYRDRPAEDAGAVLMDAGSSDAGGRDSGTGDAGVDSAVVEDAGPCGVCPAGQRCFSGSCRECGADSDCPTPGAPHCYNGICGMCTDDLSCGRFADTLACHAGACAECSATNDDACGTNVCDVRLGVCTSIPKRSAGACSPCVAEDQCRAGMSCVVMSGTLDVGGSGELGAFCLPLPSTPGTCTDRPYSVGPSMLPMVGSASLASVCVMGGSCQALADLGRTCTGDMDCGVDGFADGTCLDNRCTKFCNFDTGCPIGWTCPASGPSIGRCIVP